LFSPVYLLDLLLFAILAGPVQVIDVMGKAPTLFWADIVVLFLGARIFYVTIKHSRPVAAPRPIWWFILYLLVCGLTLAMAQDVLFSLATYKLRVFPLVVFLTAYSAFQSERDVRHLVVSITVFGVLLSLQIWYYWIAISKGGAAPFLSSLAGATLIGTKDMAQTTFGRDNYLASILVIIIPFGLYLWIQRGIRKKLAAIMAILAMISALCLTESRGGTLSLGIAIIVLMITGVTLFGMPVRYLALLAAFAGILVGAWALIWSNLPGEVTRGFTAHFATFRDDFDAGNYGSNRSWLWRESYIHSLDHPILGIGLGNQRAEASQLDMYSSAHNIYLEALLETGLLGFIPLAAFLFLVGRTWLRLARSANQDVKRIAVTGLLVYFVVLINATEEPSFWNPQYAYVIWMIFGLGFAVARTQRIRRFAR
jgi:O-antigen ligase